MRPTYYVTVETHTLETYAVEATSPASAARYLRAKWEAGDRAALDSIDVKDDSLYILEVTKEGEG